MTISAKIGLKAAKNAIWDVRIVKLTAIDFPVWPLATLENISRISYHWRDLWNLWIDLLEYTSYTLDGITYKAIKVADKIYVPDKNFIL